MDWRRKDQSARSVTRCSGRENWRRRVNILKTPRIKIKAAQTTERPSKTKLTVKWSAGFLPEHFGSLFSRLGKADCDGLLAALYRAALATFSRLSVPRFFRCIALLTPPLAAFPYLRLPDVLRELAAINPSVRNSGERHQKSCSSKERAHR